MSASLSAVVLTYNEEQNLPRCLDSLRGPCRKIFIVDSGSTDQTASIARRMGAEIIVHPFETHAKQWNWALRSLPLETDWVLALDADQALSPALAEEIPQALGSAGAETDGFYIPRKQIFRGQWIRHGGYWPKYLLKLFRRGKGWTDEEELLDFRFYVPGKTGFLAHPLVEENRKEQRLSFWKEKHLRFAELRAREEYRRRHERSSWSAVPSWKGTPDQKTLWLKRIWYRLPPRGRVFPYFFFRYVVQLGFLDGVQGNLFHFLHAFWYEWKVAVRLKELEAARLPHQA